MALALFLDSLDGLPEEVQKLYKQHDDKFMLDLDDVEDHPSVAGLKSSLEKERSERKKRGERVEELEKQLKDIGLTPEQAKELRELRDKRDQDEADKSGDVEKIVEQRTKRLKDDFQAQIDALNRENTDLKADRDNRVGQLSKLTIESQVSKAAAELGVLPKAADLVSQLAGDTWKLDDEGNPVAYTKSGDVQYGKDGKPLTISEWVGSVQKDRPYLFDGPSGGGARNNGGGGKAGPGTVSLAADPNAIGKNLEDVASGKLKVDFNGG